MDNAFSLLICPHSRRHDWANCRYGAHVVSYSSRVHKAYVNIEHLEPQAVNGEYVAAHVINYPIAKVHKRKFVADEGVLYLDFDEWVWM